MKNLYLHNDLEKDAAREVINIGLAKAADSLSFFTNEKVLIKAKECHIGSVEEYLDRLKPTSDGSKSYVLTTEIRGEMTGHCFLIFHQNEAEKLFEISLPDSVRQNPSRVEEMGRAILMEADNIISASVVTQFSNLLEYDIHGYVPIMDHVSTKRIAEVMKEKINTAQMAITFNATFVASKMQIHPQFVWTLDAGFFEGIKRLTQRDPHLELLKK